MNVKKIKRVLDEELDYDNTRMLYLYEGKPFTGVSFDPYDDGEGVEYESTFLDGMHHGYDRRWYKPGVLAYDRPFFYNMGHGIAREWHSNGQLILGSEAEYGVCLWKKKWNKKGELFEEYKLEEGTTNHDLLLHFREKYKGFKP
jgi:antitoxin component YwqK of YwqJK toxin-antitoxin module